MNLETHLANAIVRTRKRLPEVSDTMVEALFTLRRQQWVEQGRANRKPYDGS
jgi:hypothetical protein